MATKNDTTGTQRDIDARHLAAMVETGKCDVVVHGDDWFEVTVIAQGGGLLTIHVDQDGGLLIERASIDGDARRAYPVAAARDALLFEAARSARDSHLRVAA